MKELTFGEGDVRSEEIETFHLIGVVGFVSKEATHCLRIAEAEVPLVETCVEVGGLVEDSCQCQIRAQLVHVLFGHLSVRVDFVQIQRKAKRKSGQIDLLHLLEVGASGQCAGDTLVDHVEGEHQKCADANTIQDLFGDRMPLGPNSPTRAEHAQNPVSDASQIQTNNKRLVVENQQ